MNYIVAVHEVHCQASLLYDILHLFLWEFITVIF